MKKKMRIHQAVGVILALAVIVSMLPLSVIPAAAETVKVKSLSLSIGDPQPGDAISSSIIKVLTEHCVIGETDHPTTPYKTIEWFDKTDNSAVDTSANAKFEQGHKYLLTVPIATSSAGSDDTSYIFNTRVTEKLKNIKGEYYDVYSPYLTVDVDGNSAECVRAENSQYVDADCRRVAVKYDFTVRESVTGVDLTLDVPTANALPDRTAVIKNSDTGKYEPYTPTDYTDYENGVAWWDDTSKVTVKGTAAFVEGHSYKATVCLKASDDCKFKGTGSDTLPVSRINGKSCIVQRYNGEDAGDIIFVTYDFGVCTKPQVRTVKISGLDTPRPGCTPDLRVVYDGDPGYEAGSAKMFPEGIQWIDKSNNSFLDSTDVFEEGKEYSCYLLLKAKDGYIFSTTNGGDSSTVAVTVNGYSSSPQKYGAYSLSEMLLAVVDFGVCEYGIVTEVGVQDIELTPRPGCRPDYEATLRGSVYTYGYTYRINTETWRNGIHWSDITEGSKRLDPDSDTFVEGHSYSVHIDIVPQPGYKLAVDENGKSAVKATINGKTASIGNYSSDSAEQLIAISMYTDTCKTEVINSVSVSGIEEPVAGYAPAFSAVSDESAKYHIFTDFATETTNTYAIDGVSWYDRNDSRYLAPSDKFVSGHSYSCAVYLLPETGYTFPSKTDSSGKLYIPGKLNGRSDTAVRNNIGRLQSTGGVLVTYTFGAAQTPKLYTFSADKLVYPRPGKKPSYTAVPGKFTKLCTDHHSTSMFGYYNGILWYDDTEKRNLKPDDTFIEGHTYSCGIVFETTDGCEFNFTENDTDHLVGTINGNQAYGSAITSDKDERGRYLHAYSKIGVCVKYTGPTTKISKVDITDIVMPAAGEKASFTAKSLTDGVYVDTSFDDEKFHSGVSWIDMTEYHVLEENETFVDEHYYQLNVIFSADDGYEFSQNSDVSNVYTYINGEHESSMHFNDNDTTKIRLAYASYKCLPQEPVYNITVKGGSANKDGNTVFWSKFGELLTLQCSNTISAYFDHWECSDELVDIADTHSPVTTFTMPDNDVTFTAVTNGSEPEVYNITVIGGLAFDNEFNAITSSDSLKTVRILWNAPQNKQFDHWEADDNSIDIDNINSSSTTFIMPKHDVTITAVEKPIETEAFYNITVTGGDAYDAYFNKITSAKENDTVRVIRNGSDEYEFNYWESSDSSVQFDNAAAVSTTFVMPAHDVEITANESKKLSETKYFTVTFDSNNSSNETYDMTAEEGSDLTLPGCMFAPPEKQEFSGWSAGAPGEKLHVVSDIIVFAQWKDINNEKPDASDKKIAEAGCTIKAPIIGKSPSFSAQSLDSEKYTVSVTNWYLNDETLGYPDLYASDVFEDGKEYCVRIEFIANTGYKFDPATVFTINGIEADIVGDELAEIKFTTGDTAKFSGIYGDIDGDTLITANDALAVLRASVGMSELKPEKRILADVDVDGSITSGDALAVLRNSIGLSGDNLVGKPVEK